GLLKTKVSGSGLTSQDALKLTITGASLWAGVGGGLNAAHNAVTPGSVGITASGVNLTLGAITTTVPAASYTGVLLSVANASLVGVDGVDLFVSALDVQVNKSSLAGVLDWSVLTIDGTSGQNFGLALSGATDLKVAATLGVNIGGFVAAAGRFDLTRSFVSGSGLSHATALKLVISSASLWVGVGGGLNAAHDAVTAGTVGITASGVTLTLGAIKSGLTSYTGLLLGVDNASLVGIDGVDLFVSAVKVKVNKATGGVSPSPLNWSALTIDGSGANFSLDLGAGTPLSVSGTLGLRIGDGFVAAAGTFTLENSIVSGG